MNRNRRQSKYFKWGMTGTLMLVAAISFFFILYRFEELTEVISTLGDIMMPFVYGLVMAYLVCPLYNVCARGHRQGDRDADLDRDDFPRHRCAAVSDHPAAH